MSIETDTLATQKKTSQYLTFFLGGEEYGVDILKVREIRGWERPTRIPNAPDYVLGVVNLRGIVVPLVDLRLRFALEKAEFGPSTVVIVVKVQHAGKGRTVGMVVDEISDVYDISDEGVKPAPDFGGVMESEFIKGLATVDDKMIVILNVDMLINVGVLDIRREQDSVDVDTQITSVD